MSRWVDVCALNDLHPDSGVCALIGHKQVALFYLKKLQQVYAVDNFDPLGKANVLSRGMVGDINGEPMVASPLYKQHYNLKTGECFEDANLKIQTYAVSVENNRVLVDWSQA